MKPIPFQHPKIGTFFQAVPQLGNPYAGDAFLQRVLQRLVPRQIFTEMNDKLIRLGARIENEIEPLGIECEINEPYLRQFDAWGKRTDELVTCRAWHRMKEITAEEGIIASGYDNHFGEFSRIFQFAKCLVFHPSSGLYSCPIAMTDGAAKTIQALKLTKFDDVYKHLTSTIASEFWTSGQWMTERKGGSDVASGTETLAIKQSDGKYRLYGYKWFSSATDADVALTLARITDETGKSTQGTGGLSMFLLKTKNIDGSLNNIQMMKLKNKLGTRSLPTAELLLDGTQADLVSDAGRGVAAISHMLTITRLHNTTGSVSAMRRMVLLARDYSQKRSAFGQPIAKYPLHMETIAELELQTRAGIVLLFEILRLLGLVEGGKADTDDEHLLRILTPVAKLYTAKKCMAVTSEGLECFGGQGYIEDTGLPAILRNAQVMPIWEGTTNVLSLDTLRAVAKSQGEAIKSFHRNVSKRLIASQSKCPELTPAITKIQEELKDFVAALPSFQIDEAMARARIISFSLAEIEIGMLLVEHAASEVATKTDLSTALRWANDMKKLSEKLAACDDVKSTNSHDMVFDGYDFKSKL